MGSVNTTCLQSRSAPTYSVGVPCGLTKAYDKLREMGVDVWE